jgi:DNA polymerase-3 subunit epsilon
VAACGLHRETALHGALEDAWLAAQLLRALHGLPPVPMRLHGITNSPVGAVIAA